MTIIQVETCSRKRNGQSGGCRGRVVGIAGIPGSGGFQSAEYFSINRGSLKDLHRRYLFLMGGGDLDALGRCPPCFARVPRHACYPDWLRSQRGLVRSDHPRLPPLTPPCSSGKHHPTAGCGHPAERHQHATAEANPVQPIRSPSVTMPLISSTLYSSALRFARRPNYLLLM